MADLLAQKAAVGVDVRVMGWVNSALLMEPIAKRIEGYWNAAVGTLLSLDKLRRLKVGAVSPLAANACALTVGHLAGAMHLKMVVASDGTQPWAFVGGIDFVPNRVAGEMHPAGETWHDAAVAVDGPAVQDLYNLYRQLWNEQKTRPVEKFLVAGRTILTVEKGTTDVSARTLPVSTTGKHLVRVNRTLPQFNFTTFKRNPFGTKPLSFAPKGIFEVKVSWKKAIENATQYIYIEDQSFFSQDVMDWINQRLKAHPGVKVILLTGSPDPADPPNDGTLTEAINSHLLKGLAAAEIARVRFCVRKGIIVHSKLTIIDDHWLLLGSANCMRRSLYMDGEVSVAVLDENDTLAKDTRVNLWGGHFGKAPGVPRAPLNNLANALAVWQPAWGGVPPFALPSALLDARPLPLPPPAQPFDPAFYWYLDADSRDSF